VVDIELFLMILLLVVAMFVEEFQVGVQVVEGNLVEVFVHIGIVDVQKLEVVAEQIQDGVVELEKEFVLDCLVVVAVEEVLIEVGVVGPKVVEGFGVEVGILVVVAFGVVVG
jgi:hypothetical protein